MANDVRFADEIVLRCENTIMPKVRFLIASINSSGVLNNNQNTNNQNTNNQNSQPEVQAVQIPPVQTQPVVPDTTLQEITELKKQLDGLLQICQGNAAQLQQSQNSAVAVDAKISGLNNRISDLEGRPHIDYKLLDSSLRDLQNQTAANSTNYSQAINALETLVRQSQFDPSSLQNQINSLQTQVGSIQVPPPFDSSVLTAKVAQLESSMGVLYQYLLANGGIQQPNGSIPPPVIQPLVASTNPTI
jgi:chromosome segregation ATPase